MSFIFFCSYVPVKSIKGNLGPGHIDVLKVGPCRRTICSPIPRSYPQIVILHKILWWISAVRTSDLTSLILCAPNQTPCMKVWWASGWAAL